MGSTFRNEMIRLRAKEKKSSLLEKFGSMSDNDIADAIKVNRDLFLSSYEWKCMRRKVIEHYGSMCMCCKKTPRNPKLVQVDHIKPRKFYPELAMEFNNLQVLCAKCNKSKGNKHETDYR